MEERREIPWQQVSVDVYNILFVGCEMLQEKGEESFEELQELFEELFNGDIGKFGSSSQTTTCSSSSSSNTSYCETSGSSNKRNSSEMNFGKATLEDTSASGFDANFQDFCFGVSTLSLFSVCVWHSKE